MKQLRLNTVFHPETSTINHESMLYLHFNSSKNYIWNRICLSKHTAKLHSSPEGQHPIANTCDFTTLENLEANCWW
jgi:hypothetical protein